MKRGNSSWCWESNRAIIRTRNQDKQVRSKWTRNKQVKKMLIDQYDKGRRKGDYSAVR